MNIAEIIPKENNLLYVKSEEGEAGLFDITPFLESEAFSPLRDRDEFEKIHNGRYFIEWECGADLSADTIQARWKPLGDASAQPGAPAGTPKMARH